MQAARTPHSRSAPAEFILAVSTASTRALNLPCSVGHDIPIRDSQRERKKSLHYHRQSIFDFIAHLSFACPSDSWKFGDLCFLTYFPNFAGEWDQIPSPMEFGGLCFLPYFLNFAEKWDHTPSPHEIRRHMFFAMFSELRAGMGSDTQPP